MKIFLIPLNSNQKVPEVLAPLFYLYRLLNISLTINIIAFVSEKVV